LKCNIISESVNYYFYNIVTSCMGAAIDLSGNVTNIHASTGYMYNVVKLLVVPLAMMVIALLVTSQLRIMAAPIYGHDKNETRPPLHC
jgi:hypothetical protein